MNKLHPACPVSTSSGCKKLLPSPNPPWDRAVKGSPLSCLSQEV